MWLEVWVLFGDSNTGLEVDTKYTGVDVDGNKKVGSGVDVNGWEKVDSGDVGTFNVPVGIGKVIVRCYGWKLVTFL